MQRHARRPTPDPTAPGQESVWSYPRPPRVEPTGELVHIVLGGEVIASTRAAVRVLETSHAPVYYVPEDDFVPGSLQPRGLTTFCEFKGRATYFDLVGGGRVAPQAGWTYPDPDAGYEALRGRVAVYPQRVDECRVDGEVVTPVDSAFYAGWVTSRVAGPFKGPAGTEWW